jgi:hypothetical protein
MQTYPKTIYRPISYPANLKMHGLTSLPVFSEDVFSGCYEKASHQLFLASNDLKVQSAQTITQSLNLKIINEIDINREFKRHDDGEIVEVELLNTLTSKCESNLRTTCLSDDYHVDLDIENGHCVLTGYHIHEINIDTSSVSIEDRALIYSSLELVAKYQVPLMPPNWYLSATHSLIGEILDSGEFDLLTTFAMQYDSVDELVEFINDDEMFEYLDYFLGQMDGCLSTCVTAMLDYERLHSDCARIEKHIDESGLTIRDCDSTEEQVEKHIARLEKCCSPESKSLLLVLNQLLDSKTYTEFERLEMEDCQPLDFSLTIIDAPYSALIVHLQEQMFDELNQVGEPLREAIAFDENTVERFNLLTDAFKELNTLNNGK